MKRLRPMLLFVNRYYYQIFSFSNISLIKSILYRSNTFYETIGDHLTSPLISYHVNDAKYLELIRITMRRTSDLVSNKNHFKFEGAFLNENHSHKRAVFQIKWFTGQAFSGAGNKILFLSI